MISVLVIDQYFSQEVVVAKLDLKNGVHEAGWAAAHFASIEDASIAFERYHLDLLFCHVLSHI